MLKHHDDRPPDALAHGPAKASDIERVRRDMARAEQHLARHLSAALARYGPNSGARSMKTR
jgi:hypothetical protein